MPKRTIDVEEKRRELIHEVRLAEQGEAVAQNSLGARLAQGYFVKQDLAGALYWYAQAMKQGYTYAKFNAGTMLIQGEGVSSAHVELGMNLVEQAAHCGESSACGFLAHCYAQGVLTKVRDSAMSERWTARARDYDHNHFVAYGEPFDIELHGIVLTKPRIE